MKFDKTATCRLDGISITSDLPTQDVETTFWLFMNYVVFFLEEKHAGSTKNAMELRLKDGFIDSVLAKGRAKVTKVIAC